MAMLSARALSDACRYAAPSVLAGVYDPEELASIPQQEVEQVAPRTMLGEPRAVEPRQIAETIDVQPEAAPAPLSEAKKLAYMRRLADLDLISEAVAVLGDPAGWTVETSARIGPVVRDLQATREASRVATRGGEE